MTEESFSGDSWILGARYNTETMRMQIYIGKEGEKVPDAPPAPKPEPIKEVQEWIGAHLGDTYVCLKECYRAGKLYETGEEIIARDHQVFPDYIVPKEDFEIREKEFRLQELRDQVAREEAVNNSQEGL